MDMFTSYGHINLLHPEFIWPQKLIFFVRSAEEGIVFCMIQVRFHIVHNRCSLKKKKKKKSIWSHDLIIYSKWPPMTASKSQLSHFKSHCESQKSHLMSVKVKSVIYKSNLFLS